MYGRELSLCAGAKGTRWGADVARRIEFEVDAGAAVPSGGAGATVRPDDVRWWAGLELFRTPSSSSNAIKCPISNAIKFSKV